ncbi:MAG: hypothetical protein LBE75_04045 [Burkholderiales bacterium]|jgi:hypothetical protein|nr:hypothetical protein [Burkholderiales bacterium]
MDENNGWVIEGPVDITQFFEILPDAFPEATTFFVEGTSMEEEVVDCYLKRLQPGKFLAPSGTFGVSVKIRCIFDKGLFRELALLSEHHAEPEVLDHLSVYKGETPLLEWCDAFCNNGQMFLSADLSEERVAAFAKQLKLSYATLESFTKRLRVGKA